MALHSYSRCWVHLIWGTLNREKVLNKEAAARVSHYLHEYAETKSLYMKINYVNADHVHALVDLPTGLSIEEVAQLFKGSSSHWINANDLITGKFAWAEDTAPSRCRNQVSIKWPHISQVRNNIIGFARSRGSLRNSFVGMSCVNRRNEAVETACRRVHP